MYLFFMMKLFERKKKDLKNIQCLKILAGKSNNKISKLFDDTIFLPTTLKEINKIVETRAAKKVLI